MDGIDLLVEGAEFCFFLPKFLLQGVDFGCIVRGNGGGAAAAFCGSRLHAALFGGQLAAEFFHLCFSGSKCLLSLLVFFHGSGVFFLCLAQGSPLRQEIHAGGKHEQQKRDGEKSDHAGYVGLEIRDGVVCCQNVVTHFPCG